MVRQILLTVMIVVLTSVSASADKPLSQLADKSLKHPVDIALGECMEKDWSTAGMTNCTYKAHDAWDKELNKNYTALMQRLSPQEKEILKAAQKKWLEFRDSEYKVIDAVYAKLQGTMYITMRVGERLDIVKQRALALKSYLDLIRDAD